MKRNNKKGFTIVELVIVIAVIGILAAVLIPTFGSIVSEAKDSARDQEAKNAYTNYIIKTGADAKTDVKIVILDGTTPVEYYVIGGQIELDTTPTFSADTYDTWTEQADGSYVLEHVAPTQP